MTQITAEIPADVFESYRSKALKHMGEHVEIDGFRKGHMPESILIEKLSEMSIMEEMAEMAIGEHYGKILEENKIDAIGRPEIGITKIAKGSALGFTAKTAVIPEISLPDYKKIATDAKAVEIVAVTDKELEDTILNIRKSRTPIHKDHDASHDHDHDHEAKEEELVALTDDFVKGLGPFENVEDFRTKLKENIQLEKDNHAREKRRLEIMESVLNGTKTEIPQLLIDAELDKMLYRMKSDITQMGLSYEDYLKHLNKSEEVLRGEFTADAEKRVKMEFIIHEIAKQEKLVPE